MKPSDCYAIPTCHACHDKIHKKGEKSFIVEEHGWDIDYLKEYAEKLYGETKWIGSIN